MDTTVKELPTGRGAATAAEQKTSTTCIAIIWLKNQSQKPLPHELMKALNQVGGISDASLSPSRARAVVVRYERDQVCASDVLAMIRQHGYDAVLVGC